MELPLKIDSADLAKRLNEKRVSPVCPSCGQNNWFLVPEAGLLAQWVNVLPSPGIPVAAAICNHCGYVRLHALGALGLLPKQEADHDKK